jgi:hypothetical protein
VTVTQTCLAAPDVANTLLDSIGFKGSRGGIVRAVTSEMGKHPGDTNASMFWGVNHCVGGKPNPYYEAAVRYYLIVNFGIKFQ